MARFYRRLQERHVWPFVRIKLGELLLVLTFTIFVWFAVDDLITLNGALSRIPTSTAWPYLIGGWVFWSLVTLNRKNGDGIRIKEERWRLQISSRIHRVIAPRPHEEREPIFVVITEPDGKASFEESFHAVIEGVLRFLKLKKRQGFPSNRITAQEYIALRFRAQGKR